MSDAPTFTDLDEIVDRIVEDAEELAYVTLTDRTDRRREERVGRLDMGPADLLPWLDDEIVEDGPPNFTEPHQLEPDVLERAIARWLMATVEPYLNGGGVSRFRVRAYAIKGYRVLTGGVFTAEVPSDGLPQDSSLAPHADVLVPANTLSFETLEVEGAAPGMRALGSYYAQFGGLIMGSMRQIQGMNHEVIDRLSKQLRDQQGQLDEVLGALLEVRAAASMQQVHEDAEVRKQHVQLQLAEQAINGIGEAAKAFAMAKTGLDPALAGLAKTLSGSPELLETLQDGEVQALMADPENLKMVSMMLKQAAAAKAAAAVQASAAKADAA